MADFSEWGPEASGPRLVEFDRLKAAQAMSELSMQPARMEQLQAHTQLYRAQAGKYAEEAAAKKRMAEEMSRTTGGGLGEGNPLWDVANAAMRAGDPKVASQVANWASMIDYRGVKADTQKARQADIGLKNQLTKFDLQARLVRGTFDNESLAKAAREYEGLTKESTGLLDPQTGTLRSDVNWSPGLRDHLVNLATSNKDKAIADDKARHDAILAKEFGSRQQNRSFWQSFDNLRKRAEAMRKPASSKAGVLVPKTEEAKAGADFVQSEYPDMEPAEARAKGRELIDRAKQLKDQNRALRMQEAMTNTLNAMRREGKFPAAQGGKSPGGALQLPRTADGKPDPDRVIPGNWYITDKGPRFVTRDKKVLTPQEVQKMGGAAAMSEDDTDKASDVSDPTSPNYNPDDPEYDSDLDPSATNGDN